MVHLGLDNTDQVFDWLQKAYADRSEWMIYLNVEPMLDPLRHDLRFEALVREIGL